VSSDRRLVTVLLAAFTLGVVVALALPAHADERDISVGGVWICRITHDVSGYTAAQRAVEVRKRITQILSDPRFSKGALVEVHQVGPTAVVTVGDLLVFTVTPDDTQGPPVAPHTTTGELARQWAQRLAEGLSRALPDRTFHL
jgi:hypothetical protein